MGQLMGWRCTSNESRRDCCIYWYRWFLSFCEYPVMRRWQTHEEIKWFQIESRRNIWIKVCFESHKRHENSSRDVIDAETQHTRKKKESNRMHQKLWGYSTRASWRHLNFQPKRIRLVWEERKISYYSLCCDWWCYFH